MSTCTETSDSRLLELLRQSGPMGVSALAKATDVTATAVRQRLSRLMAQGYVAREVSRAGRGRPSHRYTVTEKARREAGANYGDLALVLWQEIRSVKDLEVRRGLLERIAAALATSYGHLISGTSVAQRMESVARLMAERRVPFAVDTSAELPVLVAHECPYPQLAEADRGVCAVENMLFSKLLDTKLHLAQCRLDGHNCCQFEIN